MCGRSIPHMHLTHLPTDNYQLNKYRSNFDVFFLTTSVLDKKTLDDSWTTTLSYCELVRDHNPSLLFVQVSCFKCLQPFIHSATAKQRWHKSFHILTYSLNTCCSPLPTAGSVTSFSMVCRPLSMLTVAIPAPINPAPSTAMVLASFFGLPKLFFLQATYTES